VGIGDCAARGVALRKADDQLGLIPAEARKTKLVRATDGRERLDRPVVQRTSLRCWEAFDRASRPPRTPRAEREQEAYGDDREDA
jgi:hypothetical protein